MYVPRDPRDSSMDPIDRSDEYHRGMAPEPVWLVGAAYPSEKYEFVNWDDDMPNSRGKIKVMFHSPPTSHGLSWNHMEL